MGYEITMLEFISENYQDIILNTARIFSSVFEIMLAFILANNFFKPRPKVKKADYVAFVLTASLVIFLQEYTDIGYWKYLVEGVLLSGILIVLFSGRLKHKIEAIVIFASLLTVSVLVSNLLYGTISAQMNFNPEGTTAFGSLLRITLTNVTLIPLSVLLSVILKGFGKGSSVLRIWLSLLLVPAVTLITFSVFQYIIESYDINQQIKAYIYISCIGIIIINVVVFVLFWLNQRQLGIKRENDLLTAQINQQQMGIRNLENAYNRTRNFRHDIKNHLLTLSILAENGNVEEIKKYIREMNGIIDESSYIRITGMSAVDAILNEKLYEAQSDSITTNYDVMNMEKNSIKPVDMCIILSNALDNAIEANRKIEDPEKRYIKLKMHGDETYSVISVSNPITEAPVKINQHTYATSKKDVLNHGFGLKSIESTAKKYDGEMLTKVEDGAFTLVIKLNAIS